MSPLSKIIGLLQVDSTVGDLAGNAERLESLTAIAQANGAQVAIATELAVCGYPPRDLLLQPDFITASFGLGAGSSKRMVRCSSEGVLGEQ